MRLKPFSVAIGLLAATVFAADNPINVPKEGLMFTAGKPTTFTWNPTTSGTVTLRLREGASSDLSGGTLIKANIPNSGTYTYTPPSDITRNSDYAIEIIDDSNPSNVNYSPQFVIDSKNTVASMSSASMSASSESASSATVASTTSASVSASSASSISTATKSTSASRSASASTSASASKASTSASSTESSASTTSSTSAPSSGAVGSYNEVKLGGGLLAAVFGIMAVL